MLPKIGKEFDLKLTRHPEARATMGGSSGTAAAFTMEWFCPEIYRRVLSLNEKGYTYRYVFPKDAGHNDGRATRQTLAGAPEWLWAGYPEVPAAKMPEE